VAISHDLTKRLADALMEARRPKPPQLFDYTAEAAIARAKDGSALDAKALLALAAAMLRARGPIAPFDGSAIVPAWMADYLAESLEAISAGADAGKALRVTSRRGRSKYANERAAKVQLFYVKELERLKTLYEQKFPRRSKAKGSSKKKLAETLGLSERTLRRRRQKAANK